MHYEVVDNETVILETDDPAEAYDLRNSVNMAVSFNRRNLFVRQNLVKKSEIISNALAYRFWFRNGYAYYYIDEETGTFQIFSDWGNFAYSWPRQCRATGNSLIDFIKSVDKYYLTEKLTMDIPTNQHKDFNLRKSINKIKHWICSARKNKEITFEKAHSLWEWVKEFKYHDLDDARSFYSHLADNYELSLWGDGLEDLLIFDKSESIIFLQESLIPFFQNFLNGVS